MYNVTLCLDSLDCEKFHEAYAHIRLVFAQTGFAFKPSSQFIVESRMSKHRAVTRAKLPRTLERMSYQHKIIFIALSSFCLSNFFLNVHV